MTFLAVGSIGILIVLILFFSFSTALMKSTNTFLKMYLLIVSIIAIIGATISFGFFTYASLEVALISHEEFAKNNWQYTSCSNANYEYDPKT
ncbi:hypothetical protein FACS189428_7210 [Clostridia bacterium]|nr:hypothetical protein FACS189428_7210 [Clostridia bacterium]